MASAYSSSFPPHLAPRVGLHASGERPAALKPRPWEGTITRVDGMTASQKVHLSREARDCASSFVTAAYFSVRLIPQDSRALHLELFAVPSTLATSCEVIMGWLWRGRPEHGGVRK